jgi:hypothetical protein
MAAGLGYKEFVTGDVLTAPLANGYLASQVVMVFADAAARTSAITSPQEGMFSYLKDTNATEYYTGSAWAALGGGGGGGKVLQVVQATTSTRVDVASTTYTDTGLSVSITPSASTSKVLIIATQNMWTYRGNTEAAGRIKLVRNSTDIWNQSSTLQSLSTFVNSSTNTETSTFLPVTYLDSPATTSSTTYKIQGRTELTSDGGSVNFQKGANVSTIIAMEIGA